MTHKTDMQAVLLDAMRVIAESADEIKAGCAIDDEWPDAEDKAEYDRRVAVLESVRALASRPDAQTDERGAGAPESKVLKVIDELYEEASERLKEDRDAGVFADTQTADLLTEWAGRLELTQTAFYEDVYGQLTDMLEPHVRREGINDKGQLPASVVESMSILLESWQARVAAPQAARDQHEKSDLYKEGYLAGKAAASAPSPDREQVGEDTRRVDELSMLIRQLVHALRKASPDNDLVDRAVDYLKRAGLQGSPLRVEAPDASPSRECGERQSFPERDATKTNAEQGLYRKFEVRRVDGSDALGGKHHGCEYFVLDMTHDHHAPAALRAYAQSCASTHPHLSADLMVRFGGERQEANAAYACDTCCDGDCLADNAGLPCPFSVSLRSVDECDPQSFINGVKWAREHAAGTPAQQECPHGVDDGACKQCYGEKAASAPTLGEQPQVAEPKGLIEAIEALQCPETHSCSNPELFERGWEVGRGAALDVARAILSKGA